MLGALPRRATCCCPDLCLRSLHRISTTFNSRNVDWSSRSLRFGINMVVEFGFTQAHVSHVDGACRNMLSVGEVSDVLCRKMVSFFRLPERPA